MMTAPPRKRRLSAEQRRALAMLADAGRNGVTAAIMLANGFKTKMLAHLDREGLATAMIGERMKDGGKMVEGRLVASWSALPAYGSQMRGATLLRPMVDASSAA